ncbi:integrase catalytic domain-containing protein, partial [Nephila pilipes]
GRRGLPNAIYTDNATTFHAANKELILLWQTLSSAKTQQYYAQNGITWRFIAPRAAWWGGWWERLIGALMSEDIRIQFVTKSHPSVKMEHFS